MFEDFEIFTIKGTRTQFFKIFSFSGTKLFFDISPKLAQNNKI